MAGFEDRWLHKFDAGLNKSRAEYSREHSHSTHHKLHSLRDLYTYYPQWSAAIAGTLLLMGLTGLHVLIGFPAACQALYVLPIWVATRMGGRSVGFILVSLSTVVTTGTEWLLGHGIGETMGTNFLIRFVTLTTLMLLIDQVERALSKNQRMALRDPLTGLLNRAALKEFAAHSFHQALVLQQPLTVVMIDCDGFKELNDNHGHRVGDQVLMLLARELEEHTRETDLVARMGGDEFAVVLQNTTLSEARHIMSRADEAFVAAVKAAGYSSGLSIGYSATGSGRHDLETVLDLADRSMYRKKRSKKLSAFLK
jgi:diguanylate cyclase (GGDEF)-like protein